MRTIIRSLIEFAERLGNMDFTDDEKGEMK